MEGVQRVCRVMAPVPLIGSFEERGCVRRAIKKLRSGFNGRVSHDRHAGRIAHPGPLPALYWRLLVTQYDETWCLNCGWYHNPPSEIPAREPFWRVEKCQNCRRKPLSEKKYCQRCYDYMLRYRAKKKARRA